MELTPNFIEPIQLWNTTQKPETFKSESNGAEGLSMFQNVFQSAIDQVRITQEDAENKKYLLATGQLDDAHSLPIAETKAALSVDVLVSLRNKALESYNELMKMGV